MQYRDWIDAYIKLTDNEVPLCPSCGKQSIQAIVVGSPESNIGWGIVYCTACKKGGRLSRMETTNLDWVTEDEMLSIVPADLELLF